MLHENSLEFPIKSFINKTSSKHTELGLSAWVEKSVQVDLQSMIPDE